jgi:hypothetical protein
LLKTTRGRRHGTEREEDKQAQPVGEHVPSQGNAGGHKASQSPEKKNSNISLSPAEFVFVRLNQVTHARFVFSHLNADLVALVATSLKCLVLLLDIGVPLNI